MFWLAPLIAAGASAAGGLIGRAAAGGEQDASERDKERAYNQFNGINLPLLERLKAEQLGPSALEGLTTDPALREAQMRALQGLGEYGFGGGLSAQDSGRMAEIHARNANQENAQRQAILQSMAMRGMGGSGMEFAANLANQQGAAQRNNMEGLGVSSDAADRALRSIGQYGQMAGDMDDRQYGRQANAARAKDIINQYNAGSRSDVNRYNAGLSQANFNNDMDLRRERANAYRGSAASHQQNANNVSNMWSGIGQAAGQGLGAYGMNQLDHQNQMELENLRKKNGGG